jgi:hypothetical protein
MTTQQRTAFPTEAAKAPRTDEKFVRHLFPGVFREKHFGSGPLFFEKERKRAGL